MRRPFSVVLVVALGLSSPAAGLAAEADILIRNARVVDGTGSPWFLSDVAVADGRISALGRNLQVDAKRTIDAEGRVLAPGFVDVNTHVESSSRRAGLSRLPRADNFLFDGVTTIITGNCGGSEIDIADYARSLEGLGLNVATLIGHNTVRREVVGLDDRSPTAAEIREMKALVEKAMQDGAVGLSTGLLYVPGTYAETGEVIELAKVAASYGGVYATHLREQGALLHESITEAVTIGIEAGIPVQISHLKVKGPSRWGSIGSALDLIEVYRGQGVDIVVDAYPYARASTNLGVNLPRWAVAGSAADIAGRIEDPQLRRQIASGMKDMLNDGGYEDYSFATVARFLPDESYNGLNISEINRLREGAPDIDGEIGTILDMMVEGGEAGMSQGASMVYHYMSDDDVDTIFRYPNAAVASDGGVVEFGVGQPHPRSYGTNARVIASFVQERNVLSLEDAVRRMTSLPARAFALHDRGIVRPGFAADLVLFDPARVQDNASFEDPHRYSDGFDYVIVNGVIAIDGGEISDARGGQFVRHAR
jgi:N-acyl-D-amino-acid deacylase